MRTPMMEKIVQTAKQTVKATVDVVSARAGVVAGVVEAGCDMVIGLATSFSARRVRTCRRGRETKKAARSRLRCAAGSGGLARVPRPRGETLVDSPLSRCRNLCGRRPRGASRNCFRAAHYSQLHNEAAAATPIRLQNNQSGVNPSILTHLLSICVVHALCMAQIA
jgi:hypothetical protein